MLKKNKNKIKVPRTVKKDDLKLYVSFYTEHKKEKDTQEDMDKKWKAFKKSLREAAKNILGKTKREEQ